MTRSEEAIIKGFLMGANKAVEDARAKEDATKLAAAHGAYDIICRLAEQLKVDNPCKK
jgi:6,7-dimethyl-8-ribityllumazine synthase